MLTLAAGIVKQRELNAPFLALIMQMGRRLLKFHLCAYRMSIKSAGPCLSTLFLVWYILFAGIIFALLA